MKRKETFAAMHHTRWTDDEEPKATVIRSWDGFTWFQVCETDPESATEIAEALYCMSELRALREAGDALAYALATFVGNGTEEFGDLLVAWEEARRG